MVIAQSQVHRSRPHPSDVRVPTSPHSPGRSRRRSRKPRPTPYGARAVIYALVTSIDEDVRQRQRAHLVEHATADVVRELDRLEPLVRVLPTALRLPIVDVTLPSLRGLTPDQFARFRSKLVYLMGADGRLSLFEWTLGRIVLTHLGSEFGVRSRPGPAPKRPALVLLSAVSKRGTMIRMRRRPPWPAACDSSASLDSCSLRRTLRSKCSTLPSTSSAGCPARKRRVVAAAAATITTDDEVTVTEAELFRAIADTLGVPVPPLLAGQSLVGPLGRGSALSVWANQQINPRITPIVPSPNPKCPPPRSSSLPAPRIPHPCVPASPVPHPESAWSIDIRSRSRMEGD